MIIMWNNPFHICNLRSYSWDWSKHGDNAPFFILLYNVAKKMLKTQPTIGTTVPVWVHYNFYSNEINYKQLIMTSSGVFICHLTV